MLLALGAIALVALGFLITWLLTHRHHHHAAMTTTVVTTHAGTTTGAAAGVVVVPEVRHLNVAAAEAVLSSVGLKPRITGTTTTGTVATQAPAKGLKVAKGSQVLLGIARAGTTTANTTTANTTTAPTTTTVHTTTAQTTTAAVPPQPTSATVPDLSGMQQAGAATALGRAGLLASIVFVPSNDTLGTVEGQGKSGGTTVPYHSHVQVNISTGPGNKPQETVPNVIGKTLQQALAAINAVHLRLIYLKYPVSSRSQAGHVVQQTPLGGGKAPQNAQVIVYLGAFRAG